ncbi:ribonuclease D [Pontibacter actiniarum]|uniref:Ribonuclease D n=1 Tax=Pontibacter actiniarum TaxID=323450 RepID=A0A1X9YWD1_9BACT|nr:HRDC domain-containing protein [Pontibacter actiniarum]ARS37246.1 ribonuclease D [Pontibacter actiniarum]
MENTTLTHDGVTIKLIEEQEQLLETLATLSRSQELALDLEFDQNRFTYGFNLCLVQIADENGTCYIIDPFAVADLQPLFDLFEDGRITKIIHHSNNDILLLDKLGCNIRGVMDTDVAAKILNYERSSLATVLKEEFDMEIDKSQQSSNWNKRPLTEAQLKYAAIDVIYLHRIKAKLVQEIADLGRLHWLQEENQLLEALTYSEPENPHLKLKNAFRLNFYQQHILKHLFAFRDQMAMQFNKPASYVISNEALVELASTSNVDVHEWLNHTKGIHGGLKRSRNEKLLVDALSEARQSAKDNNISHDFPSNRWPRPVRTPETEQRREELVQVQKQIMANYGEFASRLIINQSLINDYSYTGELRCTKEYATQIVLSTASELGISLPTPVSKNNSSKN